MNAYIVGAILGLLISFAMVTVVVILSLIAPWVIEFIKDNADIAQEYFGRVEG